MSHVPQGWVRASLGALCSSPQYGWTTSARTDGPGGLRFLRTTDITHGRLDWATVPYCAEEPPRPEQYALASGDIVISRAGSVGFSCRIVDVEPSVFASYLIRFRPSREVDGRYISYFLHSRNYWQQIRSATSGITLANVNAKKLAAIQIPLAPRREQERIVAAIEEQLSRVDAGVAALQRVRQNLKRMRIVAFAGLVDGVSNWTTLGAIADVVGGITKDAKRQSDPWFVEVPYLRVANVQRGYLDLDMVTTIRVPVEKATKLRLESGDVLFNEGGDRDKLGRGWVWQGQIPDCIHQNHVFRARLHEGVFEPKFVSMHGNTFGRIWFEQMGKQTTNLASLNLKTLKSFPVPNLSIDEQRLRVADIEQRVSLVEALDVAIQHAQRRSERLRSSILAAAFSGTLVSQDPTDEPSSVLLDRIAAALASHNGYQPDRPRKPRTKVTA
jgi:type I restriction enzyme S subunit